MNPQGAKWKHQCQITILATENGCTRSRKHTYFPAHCNIHLRSAVKRHLPFERTYGTSDGGEEGDSATQPRPWSASHSFALASFVFRVARAWLARRRAPPHRRTALHSAFRPRRASHRLGVWWRFAPVHKNLEVTKPNSRSVVAHKGEPCPSQQLCISKKSETWHGPETLHFTLSDGDGIKNLGQEGQGETLEQDEKRARESSEHNAKQR